MYPNTNITWDILQQATKVTLYLIKQQETSTVSCNRPGRLHSLLSQATGNQYKVLRQARKVTLPTHSSNRKPVQCPATGQECYIPTQSSDRKPVQCPATGQKDYTPYPAEQQETNTKSCNRPEKLFSLPNQAEGNQYSSCSRPEMLHSLPSQAARIQYKVLQQARKVTLPT